MAKFRTIIADPPWRYIGRSGRGFRHASKDKYPTMDLATICALPVGEVAATDSVLLLWCTWPLMPYGLKVIEAWGFSYTSGFPWIKMDMSGRRRGRGIGFHTRSASEFVLIGIRGSCCPPPEKRLDGVIFCPGGRHSAKPDAQYDYAEAYGGPYLEIFARPDGGLFPVRDGWIRIGNEITGRDIREDLALLASDAGEHANA